MDTDYRSMKPVNLREIAKERGLKKVSTLKKADLINELIKSDQKQWWRKVKKTNLNSAKEEKSIPTIKRWKG